MSAPDFSVRYVPTRSMIPNPPVRGRVYFIGDEHVLLVNHGPYIKEYGATPGPQGSNGDPDIRYQEQALELSSAVLSLVSAMQFRDVKGTDLQKELEDAIENLRIVIAKNRYDYEITDKRSIDEEIRNRYQDNTLDAHQSDLSSLAEAVTDILANEFEQAQKNRINTAKYTKKFDQHEQDINSLAEAIMSILTAINEWGTQNIEDIKTLQKTTDILGTSLLSLINTLSVNIKGENE